LEARHITLAEILREEGYDTYAIVSHSHVKKEFGFSQGFDYFDDNFKGFKRNADEVANLSIKLLRKIKPKKFFLWLHVREPHAPYNPPEEYKAMFLSSFKGEDKEKFYIIQARKQFASNSEIHRLRAEYDGNIRFADDNLRKIFEYLSKQDLLRNTVVIITADHGESLGEHYIFSHNELYYGILRVSLIIKIPNIKGSLKDYPVSSVDIFPTILDIVSSKRSYFRGLRGKNLFLKRDGNETQFSEYLDRYSIIKNNWRLYIDNRSKKEFLFDLTSDSNEEINLIELEKDTYQSLRSDLTIIINSKAIRINREREIRLDKQLIEELKSLGYMQ
jgi:arylsulfatase A-like enzyme